MNEQIEYIIYGNKPSGPTNPHKYSWSASDCQLCDKNCIIWFPEWRTNNML